MKKTFSILLPLILAFVAMSCNNGPNNVTGLEAPDVVFSGKVMGVGGGPMAGVGIHYMFQFDPTSSVTPLSKTLPTTVIEFDLPEDGYVTVRVLRYGSRRYVSTLINNELMAAGQNEVQFDVSSLTNGLYIVQIITGSYTKEFVMALMDFDVSRVVQTEPLAVTDAEGRFSIPYSWLGIGRELVTSTNGIDLYNVRISNRIEVILYKPGYTALVKTVILNPGSSTDVEMHLQ